MKPLSAEELVFIGRAATFFEKPTLFIRGVNLLSVPLERVQRALPDVVKNRLKTAVEMSLQKALVASLKTLSPVQAPDEFAAAGKNSKRTGNWHTATTALAGGIGGFFGAPALLLELPVTTVLMLRSIAATGAQFGEDLSRPETALECLLVFALGGPSTKDDLTDTAYYGTRIALAAAVREATVFISSAEIKQILRTVETGGAPQLVRLLTEIASYFEIRITKKLLAQSAPILGAVGGAAINTAFTHFFNQCALYHFGLRKLERTHGASVVRTAFEKAAR